MVCVYSLCLVHWIRIFYIYFILFLVDGRLAVKPDAVMGLLHNCFVVSYCFNKFVESVMPKRAPWF